LSKLSHLFNSTVKHTFQVSFGTNQFEQNSEKNLKWGKFNDDTIDLGSLKYDVK
jgi:hypothetical protein